jgi:hypothetical protein
MCMCAHVCTLISAARDEACREERKQGTKQREETSTSSD